VLEQFAVVATYDELPAKVKERWGGIFSSFGLNEFPQETREDQQLTRKLIEAIRQL